MSVRNFKLVISQRARADIRSILAFTQKRWGVSYRQKYRASLFDGFEMLREHPEIGAMGTDYDPSTRSFSIAEHIAIYKIQSSTLVISRVIHPRQDMSWADEY